MKAPPGGWALATQASIAVLVTVCLSIWQVGRGFEKIKMSEDAQNKLNEPPLFALNWRSVPHEYRRIELRGIFDQEKLFLVENQFRDGRPGYWVIGVFDTDNGRFLVNRGWTAITGNLYETPQIETPLSSQSLQGVLWPNEPFSPARPERNVTWPMRMYTLNTGAMARLSGAFAQEVRLLPNSSAVLIAAPTEIHISSAIHWGYAFQWLLIGGLVIAGYWFFNIRNSSKEE